MLPEAEQGFPWVLVGTLTVVILSLGGLEFRGTLRAAAIGLAWGLGLGTLLGATLYPVIRFVVHPSDGKGWAVYRIEGLIVVPILGAMIGLVAGVVAHRRRSKREAEKNGPFIR